MPGDLRAGQPGLEQPLVPAPGESLLGRVIQGVILRRSGRGTQIRRAIGVPRPLPPWEGRAVLPGQRREPMSASLVV